MTTFQKSTEKQSNDLMHKFHHEKKTFREQAKALQGNLQTLKCESLSYMLYIIITIVILPY